MTQETITDAERGALRSINDKMVDAHLARWGKPPAVSKLGEIEYELQAIRLCKKGLSPRYFHWFSTSEEITLSLGLGRHDLLRPPFDDPENAWRRLDDRQRAIVRDEVGDAVWMIPPATASSRAYSAISRLPIAGTRTYPK